MRVILATTIPGYVNSAQAAIILKLDESLVRRYCRQKKLEGFRAGKNWVISRTEITRFRRVKRHRGRPKADA